MSVTEYNRRERRAQNRASVLDFIGRYCAENGFSPSFREIAMGTGLRSTSTVSAYVHELIEAGCLTGSASQPRRLRPARRTEDENWERREQGA